MKSSLPLLSLACLVATACGPTDTVENETAAQREEIVGGTVANGDPAVVAIAIRYGPGYQSLCTGTLIAPKTVLTAAHCIYAYGQNITYYVTTGTRAASPTKAVRVQTQIKHPSYNGSVWDFGVLRLAEPMLGVTPIPMNEKAMTQSLIGQTIRHVGFGITSGGGSDSGTKREVSFGLRSIQALTIESGAQGKQTCQGDSGGPGFMVMPGDTSESVVGVVSYGDEDCIYGGYDGRVDVVAPWVRQTMATWEAPSCELDGKCLAGCAPIDQDCACAADGVCDAECSDPALDVDCPADCVTNNVCSQLPCGRPDADCVPEGQLCIAASQCKERLCVNDPQHTELYCTRACDAATPCPTGLDCESGSCIKPQLPSRNLRESCNQGRDFCVDSICTGPATGINRCVEACVITADCPNGAICEAGNDGRRYCRPGDLRFNVVTIKAASIALGDEAPSCASAGSAAGLWFLGALLLRRRRHR